MLKLISTSIFFPMHNIGYCFPDFGAKGIVFGGVSQGQHESDGFLGGDAEQGFYFFFIIPAEHAGSETQFGGLEADVFGCDADIDQGPFLFFDLHGDAVDEAGFFDDDGDDNRSLNSESVDQPDVGIRCTGQFGAERILLCNDKRPGLGVAGGRSQSGGFQAKLQLFGFNRDVCIAADALAVLDQGLE